MVGIATGAVALLVTLCTLSYFGVASVLLLKLALDGAETRRLLSVPLLPTFCQSLGIPVALLGFALGVTSMAATGALAIALGVLLTSERSIGLHPSLEVPLLWLASLALSSIALFRAVI